MIDTKTGKEIKRDIDISNLYFDNGTCLEIERNADNQHAMLNEWINERGNEQHDTTLKLISCYLK